MEWFWRFFRELGWVYVKVNPDGTYEDQNGVLLSD